MVSQKSLIASLFFCFSVSLVFGQPFNSKFKFVKELGGIEEYIYEPNGLSILLIQDNSAPVVTTQITYKVGSKHEVPGNTGSTHLLEHLMFKGTAKYNKETTSIANALQNIGAKMNATTWNDRTNYYETIPSNYLELALDIEADRMRNCFLKPEDKAAEMTVVRNEFERGENNPTNLLRKEIWSTAFMAHPYHHPTIGWLSDIENAPNEKLKEFYNTYYWPNNATLSIIGDFNKADVFKLVDKYFGEIPKAPHEFPQPYTEEPEQFGPKKIIIKKPGQQGVVLISFKTPGKLHKDYEALAVLSEIIQSGASSILNKTFVDTGLGTNPNSSITGFKDHNLFSIGVSLTPKAVHQNIDDEIIAIIKKIKENGVAQEDIDRVIIKEVANYVLASDGSFAIASILNEEIASGDWTNYINGIEKLKKVTAEDIKRVANTYLIEDQSITGYFIPKKSGASDNKTMESSSLMSEDGKVFYRDCDEIKEDAIATVDNNIDSAIQKPELISSKFNYTRKTVEGIDITMVKTGAKGFVNVVGSINAGSSSLKENKIIATLTANMLLKGTKSKDKYALSQTMELLGTKINFNADTYKTTFSFKCLSNNVNDVMVLLADLLRNPSFNQKEFDLLKQQFSVNIQNKLEDPSALANIKLSQLIYEKGHPEYSESLETQIETLKIVTVEDIKTFYKKFYGSKEMHLVFVGDINEKQIFPTFKKAFKAWTGGIKTELLPLKGHALSKTQTEIISVKGKPSAQLVIAQYTGLNRNDTDFQPFKLATFVLGGGFSGRLMQTVRDVDGLTYSIGAMHAADSYSDGYFAVNASFNPTLLAKGEEATMLQINKWINDGVSATELANKKSNLIGSFKVTLSTSGGIASSILSFINQGKTPSYIDEYPKDIEAITLDQANAAIKKYINPDAFIILKSGSIDNKGLPLK